MRFFPALIGALLITVAVFLFMQGLIERGKAEDVQIRVIVKSVDQVAGEAGREMDVSEI